MRAFRRRRGVYVAALEGDEATILARVVADTSMLLGVPLRPGEDPAESADPLTELSWSTEGVDSPTDPALARLLPDASRTDDELSQEFRRLTESELRASKVARLRMVWDALRVSSGEIRVPTERALDFAAALTDVRLVIAERLGIRTEADAEEIADRVARGGGDDDEDEVQLALGMVYSALSWLQESLLQVMLPTLGE
ncbi:DUF2017 domain-containing protein [Ruania zhangjianzhongii]|uniref:DUF2017 domain-containing protein n=1 Tax=Ruania zhangjianzhongii TaxID=2603206 RepID=UPI0011C7AB63|nr:DUF2017 domain-containing protein [Ruania zhangjianzhongii]